jgi:type IV pilus assembly protein PilF
LKNAGSLLLMTLLVALAGCVTTGPGAPGSSGQAELKTASDFTDNQRRAQIRLELAINYYREGQLPVALDELKNALQSDPNLADAYGVRALIYMNMNETSLADENFKTAIRLAPNNPELTSNYGWFLCQNGRAAESIAYFEETLKSRTYQQPSKALNNAGLCSLAVLQASFQVRSDQCLCHVQSGEYQLPAARLRAGQFLYRAFAERRYF